MNSKLRCDTASPMSPTLHHACTRVPVTTLASCGALLIAAEGPFLRFYHAKDSRFICSQQVFKAQAVHGISVYSAEHNHVTKLAIWGGRLVRAIEIDSAAAHQFGQDALIIHMSDLGTASDWILDLAPRPHGLDDDAQCQRGTCVAVTAHNALLQVMIEKRDVEKGFQVNPLKIFISDLTSSSRSILYSAHLCWESLNRVLVAAGTAFGEIIYWSWSEDHGDGGTSRIHRVFLGHEGSVFGVHISKELSTEHYQKLRRVVASCSDDRTIRIWNVSDVTTDPSASEAQDDDMDIVRTRHTGFSNQVFDAEDLSSSNCLAIGWGHLSRIWTVRFLRSSPCNGSLFLQSAGEDATARTWELTTIIGNNKTFAYKLLELDCAAHHSGKNLWSTAGSRDSMGLQQVTCGGADSKITTAPLVATSQIEQKTNSTVAEYAMKDVLSLAQPASLSSDTAVLPDDRMSSKKADFFRSYCFLDDFTLLLTTNLGKVFVGSMSSNAALGRSSLFSCFTFIAQPKDLVGYSVCTNDSQSGLAFIGGAHGSIYMYRRNTTALEKLHSVSGKVGDIFVADVLDSVGGKMTALFFTLVGQSKAQLVYIDLACDPEGLRVVEVPISELLTGSIITSMVHARASGQDFLILGFRRGSIAVYSIRENELGIGQATLFRVVEKAHSDETVTSLAWTAPSMGSTQGYLFSVGRNGRLAVHHIDLSANTVELVHDLPLPFGPNIEGLYLQEDRLLVHGFSSKKWFLHDVTAEEEVMGIDTGGAHRIWTFRPRSSLGGTLVWTRASSMRVCSQNGPNHVVIRSGGHGREIKAIAVSPRRFSYPNGPLVATGAEDTDIKIFQYVDGDLFCRRTLRKHTTGIQHLQWAESGDYLFSSGGCEEFYVWRIRELQSSSLAIGVVCEHVYTPESEHSDLRIMSFDVISQRSSHTITMVFSDSSIKVYRYDTAAAVRWQPLAKGLYFTSCLTQCSFLSPHKILTAGTDGRAVVWPLSPEMNRPSVTSSNSTLALTWQHPARIHQNSSKVMVSHAIDRDTTLIISGGDDGSLAFLLALPAPSQSSTSPAASYASPPILVSRVHASAVTACATLVHNARVFLLTSGNDEWIRLWEVTLGGFRSGTEKGSTREYVDAVGIRRVCKIKTNVADVSSMAVLDADDKGADASVLVCGVGMEVIRIAWNSNTLIEEMG